MDAAAYFDYARAAAAIAALERVARMVEDHAAARARLASGALRHWRGRHACAFEADQRRLSRDAAALAAALRRAARRVAAAAEAARADQRRRQEQHGTGRETGAPRGARF